MYTENMDAIKGATTERPQPLNTEESEIPDDKIQQDGVQVADAVTTTWSRKHLIIAYTRWENLLEDSFLGCPI